MTLEAFFFQRIDAASLLELTQHRPERIPDMPSGVLGNLLSWARARVASQMEGCREASEPGEGERSARARSEAARKKEQRRKKAARLKELSARADAGMSTEELPPVVVEHNNDAAVTDKGKESDGPSGADAPNGAAEAASLAVGVTGQADVRAAQGDAVSLEGGEESLPASGAGKKRKLKSSSEIARDECQQAQRAARQSRSKYVKLRKVEKLTRKGLTTPGAGHKSCKRAGGIAKAKRASRQVAHAGSNLQEAEGGSAHAAQPAMCKFWLTSADTELVLASTALPDGMTQKVETCVNEHCQHAHTSAASAANRERLIQTRKRKVAMFKRPQQQQPADEERQGWLDFDFTKGWGFINPVKPAQGRDPRRQKLFFHVTDWKGTTPLQQSDHAMPLRVRYIRVLNHREQGSKYRAVQVSASGPSKRPKPVSTGPPRKTKKNTARSRASDKAKKQKAKK